LQGIRVKRRFSGKPKSTSPPVSIQKSIACKFFTVDGKGSTFSLEIPAALMRQGEHLRRVA
jgi:hypothetical protein